MDVSRDTGSVTLYIEAGCGFRPIIGWHSLDGVKEFATMLLDLYQRRIEETHATREISNNIIRQALGEDTDPLGEEPWSG